MDVIDVQFTAQPAYSDVLRVIRCLGVRVMYQAVRYRGFTRAIFVMVLVYWFRGELAYRLT